MSLVGVSVGAQGCRAASYALDGRALAWASREYAPTLSASGVRVLDSRRVWRSIQDVLAEVASRTKLDPVTALSVSSNSLLVPVSQESGFLGGAPVGAELAEPYVAQLVSEVGRDTLFEITGCVPEGSPAIGLLCWVRDHLPELYRRAWHFVPWSGLACSLLGGSMACDVSLASRTMLYDINARQWSRPIIKAAGLTEFKLPPISQAGEPAGVVSAGLAHDLGLPPGVRLAVGAHEHCCSALGAGATCPGQAVYDMGGAIRVMPVFEAVPLRDMLAARSLELEPCPDSTQFLTVVSRSSGGSVLRWFRDELAPMEYSEARRKGLNVYDQLLGEMPTEPSDLLVMASFAGDGPPGAISGLALTTRRGDIIRALLEGITMGLVDDLRGLQQLGIAVTVLKCVGGGSRSRAWLQLTADILGIAVEQTPVTDAATFGAAMLAGVGSGVYSSIGAAGDQAVKVLERMEPEPARSAIYQVKQRRYRQLSDCLVALEP